MSRRGRSRARDKRPSPVVEASKSALKKKLHAARKEEKYQLDKKMFAQGWCWSANFLREEALKKHEIPFRYEVLATGAGKKRLYVPIWVAEVIRIHPKAVGRLDELLAEISEEVGCEEGQKALEMEAIFARRRLRAGEAGPF